MILKVVCGSNVHVFDNIDAVDYFPAKCHPLYFARAKSPSSDNAIIYRQSDGASEEIPVLLNFVRAEDVRQAYPEGEPVTFLMARRGNETLEMAFTEGYLMNDSGKTIERL